jgi:hypothetical protein
MLSLIRSILLTSVLFLDHSIMFSAKLFAAALLFFGLFSSQLIAQKLYEDEIACNEFCAFDSILFFQEVRPEEIADKQTGLNTNLYGPYFNQFPQIRSDIISALEFYPELANARIQFKYKPIKQTMNSRPAPGNIFRRKAHRHYTIIVNNNKGKHKGLPFEELSFNIKIGWLGHELAHICEYETINNWETFWFALKYISSKQFIRKVERNTDLITIQHGLACPLYDGIDYLFRNKDIGEKYRKYAQDNSLSLKEIKCFWCQSRHEK